MATSEGIPSSIDIEFLELNDNPYFIICPFHDNLLNVKTENFYDRLGDKFCVGRASGYIKRGNARL